MCLLMLKTLANVLLPTPKADRTSKGCLNNAPTNNLFNSLTFQSSHKYADFYASKKDAADLPTIFFD